MIHKSLLREWTRVWGDADWPNAPPSKWSITHSYFAEQWK